MREQERLQREAERQRAREDKEAARRYAEARQAEAQTLNAFLAAQIAELEGVLTATLGIDDFVDFEALREKPVIRPFGPGGLAQARSRPEPEAPAAPTGIGKLVPGARRKHEEAVAAAQAAHDHAIEFWKNAEHEREQKLAAAQAAYDERVADAIARAEAQNAEVDAFREAVERGEPSAVVDYFGLVLEASRYPEGFPKSRRLAYVPESRQLVLECELPTFDVVPETREFRYVKVRDEITTSPRPANQRKALYASAVAQTSLRCVHELFEADRNLLIDTVVFNGIVDSIDKRTGQPARTCLVTLRTTRDAFHDLDLALVDPAECLKGLNAGVSKSPAELAPVRPVLDFDMVDPRFVEEADVLSGLDERPNLMDLTPGEFEGLITNLFEKMGLETRQTRPSRDGGVDCVAYDTRPVLGGKVVIQAKRYKNTVGVSAVRDLFGTVHNEGAVKGILVTTSGYGKASHEFANDKPLELLDGTNLLYLLHEHAQLEARIEPPEDWTDPDGAVLA
ncbi:MAG TPA: restriction endonuclease [Baekduia sp.]|nr:restriction endonuclease [Baekduia sp.]